MRDYATIYINGYRRGILDRRLGQDSININSVDPDATLDILVENNGRINYGPYLIDNRQGITEKVTLNNEEVVDWKMYKFPFNSLQGFQFMNLSNPKKEKGKLSIAFDNDEPTLSKGIFTLTKTGDTFLDMRDFGKGFVFVNGHNLGKYWNIGPQQTIYLPGCWLKKGLNSIVVFDELKNNHQNISAIDHPILDEVAKN